MERDFFEKENNKLATSQMNTNRVSDFAKNNPYSDKNSIITFLTCFHFRYIHIHSY